MHDIPNTVALLHSWPTLELYPPSANLKFASTFQTISEISKSTEIYSYVRNVRSSNVRKSERDCSTQEF